MPSEGSQATAPQTFDELVVLLRERYDQFSDTKRKLADRVLSDPEVCAFMTITELAQAVGVNESTVVRFAASLGLDGYPALTRLCRQMLQEQLHIVRRFDSLGTSASEPTGVFQRAVEVEYANLARTFAAVDQATWDQVVDALWTATKVYTFGLRLTYSTAHLLSYLLQLVRDEVHHLSLGSGDLPDRLRRIRPGDVFVATGIHPYVRDVVRATEYARSVGVTTVALTDNPSSPLARHADHTVYVEAAGGGLLRSVTAFTSLVQVLAAAVAAAGGEAVREELAAEEELLADLGVHAVGEVELLPRPSALKKSGANSGRGRRTTGRRQSRA